MESLEPVWTRNDPEEFTYKFATVSFVNPESVLQRKEQFLFQEFRKQYVVDTRLKCWEEFLAFLASKHGLRLPEVMTDFQGFRKVHEATPEVRASDVEEAWEAWALKHERRLTDEWEARTEECNVRIFKIRSAGFGRTLDEAKRNAEKITKRDGGRFLTAVVEIGGWAPFDRYGVKPETETIQPNERVQNLLEKTEEERQRRDQFFEEYVTQQKAKIQEANAQRRLENQRQLLTEQAGR